MADDSGIDPRYAAQFQRGYDPAVHPPAAPTEATPVAPGPARLAGGPQRTAERVPPPPRLGEPVPTPAPPPAPTPEAAAPTDDEAPLGLRRLRFDLVLLVGGAVLVAVALVLWWGHASDQANFYGGPVDATTLYLQTLRYQLAQPLFLSGVLAVVAGVVVQAIRRMP